MCAYTRTHTHRVYIHTYIKNSHRLEKGKEQRKIKIYPTL